MPQPSVAAPPAVAAAPVFASDDAGGDDLAVDEVDEAAGDEAAGDDVAIDDVAMDDGAERPSRLGELRRRFGELRRRFGLLPIRVRLAIAGTLAALVLVTIVVMLATRDPAAACAEEDDPVAALWDGRRDAIHTAITATGVSFAESTWERVAARLDAHAGALRASSLAACAAHRRGERSDATWARQSACLSGHHVALKVLTDALASADARTVEGALFAIGELPPPAACDDIEALPAAIVRPEDPAVAAEAGLRREQLVAARLAVTLRRASEGLASATPLLTRARELGDRPVEVEVAGIIGDLHAIAGDLAAAELALTDAVWLADLVGDDELLARHMAALLRVIGTQLARPEDAIRWRRHAETVIARLPAGSRGAAQLIAALGTSLFGASQPGPALELLQKALALAEAQDGPDHEHVAAALAGLAAAQAGKGDLAAARAGLTRALTISETRLGPDHPGVAAVLRSFAAVDASSGDLDAAEAHLVRALAIQEASLGREHRDLAPTLSQLGRVLAARGDQPGAGSYFERALAILAARPDDAPVRLAELRHALIRTLRAQDVEPERQRELAGLALATFREQDAERHSDAISELESWLAEQPEGSRVKKAKKPATKKAKKKPTKKAKKKPKKK